MTIGKLLPIAIRATRSPSRWLAWLPVQRDFLDDQSRQKLLRAGNQFWGKTTCLCEEILRFAENRHFNPRFRDRPLRIIAIALSNPQSIEWQKKLWEMVDPDTIDPRTEFDHVNGFRGRLPACRFRNGTVVLFKSGEAGPGSIAGETADVVLINEPTTEAIYDEADRRVLIKGGYLIMGMTPVNQVGPLDWLKKLVDAGVISEHHTTFTPESLIPVGRTEPRRLEDGRICDAAFVAKERAKYTGREYVAAIRLDGGWETPPEGQMFPAFDRRVGGQHVTREHPAAELDLYVGIDHGEREHKQCAVLVGIERGAGLNPPVWVLDEYVGDGLTTHDQDAAGILAMLARWDVSWSDLAAVHGDKPHDIQRIVGSAASKSNSDLAGAIARAMRKSANTIHPKIRQAKRGKGGGAGSVRIGLNWLHQAMLREDGFRVHASCERMVESLHRTTWGRSGWNQEDDEWKDIVDALRYALWPVVFRHSKSGQSVTIRVR